MVIPLVLGTRDSQFKSEQVDFNLWSFGVKVAQECQMMVIPYDDGVKFNS